METQTQEKVQEGRLVEIMLGEKFALKGISPNNAIILADGKRELLSRIIPASSFTIVCTLSKMSDKTILEKTYDYTNSRLVYLCDSKIPEGHPSYEILNEQINENLK